MAQGIILRKKKQDSDGVPTFTYSGTYELIEEDETNWKIRFLTSGTLTITKLNGAKKGIDMFIVGGGASGGWSGSSTANWDKIAHGGGGFWKVVNDIKLEKTAYTITIGNGGSINGQNGSSGGNSNAFGTTANGGGTWSNGGVACFEWGITDGVPSSTQNATLLQSIYSGTFKGDVGDQGTIHKPLANTGQGGKRSKSPYTQNTGGSGIVIIRNAR